MVTETGIWGMEEVSRMLITCTIGNESLDFFGNSNKTIDKK